MAPAWAQQPTAPPPLPARPLVTPAARAYLREHGVAHDLNGGLGLPAVIHLAEARTLAQPRAEPEAPAIQEAWAAVDVLIPPDQDPAERLVRVIMTACAWMREAVDTPVRAVVRFSEPRDAPAGSSCVVMDDAGSLSVSGIQRQLIMGRRTAGEADRGGQLEVIDGSGLGANRLLSSAHRRVVVTIGTPARRIMPGRQRDGQEVIAVGPVLEVWVHGGGLLDAFGTARLASTVGRALGTVEAA
jgi:hypothetical protein